jgi:hypothetical protein
VTEVNVPAGVRLRIKIKLNLGPRQSAVLMYSITAQPRRDDHRDERFHRNGASGEARQLLSYSREDRVADKKQRRRYGDAQGADNVAPKMHFEPPC